ncbi:MAG: hypothetical protein HKP62_01435 [Sulfurovum sp.]|nr:hypothetical protein [Sulfurovum sp.]NNJ44657.1 hypothetical protein [Sulfurovum sp.]
MKIIVLVVLLSAFGLAKEDKKTTFACEFTTYATEKGTFKGDPVRFTIVSNDTNGTYTLKGTSGQSKGNIIRGDKGLSFIKVTKLGNITTTTITYVAPFEKEQKAVHSRNILAGGKLLASQYYGVCHKVDEIQTKKVRFNISKEKRDRIYRKLKIKKKLKSLPKKDAQYILSALEGVFPSRLEMEEDMSIEGMILVSKIMDYATKSK